MSSSQILCPKKFQATATEVSVHMILRFDGMRSWLLTYKRLDDGIAITDGWKRVVDDLGFKLGCLLVFTPFESYVDFMLTAGFLISVLWILLVIKKALSGRYVMLVSSCSCVFYVLLSAIVRHHLSLKCYNRTAPQLCCYALGVLDKEM
ncbi:putative transcription factor B3-Domain family [Helianthus anomalus]